MPQKTRREKQIAELRRKLAMKMQNASTVNPLYSISAKEAVPKEEIIKEASQNLTSGNFMESLTLNTKYVTADLRKTFFLTMLVIVFELVLFYVWEIR